MIRYSPLSQFSAQLNDALYRQKTRLEVAWAKEQEARRLKKASTQQDQFSSGTKHPLEAESSAQAAKRARMEAIVMQGSGTGKGPEVDVSGFAIETVVDVVMAGLAVVDAELMRVAFEVSRFPTFAVQADGVDCKTESGAE
jgi:symplekin